MMHEYDFTITYNGEPTTTRVKVADLAGDGLFISVSHLLDLEEMLAPYVPKGTSEGGAFTLYSWAWTVANGDSFDIVPSPIDIEGLSVTMTEVGQ
jgi:hypothetical protein